MENKPLSEIKNRRDFEEAFQVAMSGAHKTLRALWHFEKEQNLPKSYLVEFHPRHDEGCQHLWTTAAVHSALEASGRSFGARVQPTKDDSLLYLKHSEKAYEADFIVDCLNPRFLVFHTLSNANATDRFIFHRLTQYHPEFDLFWFPVSELERVEKREQVNGWEAQFDPLLEAEAHVERADQETTNEEEVADDVEAELPVQSLSRPRLNIHLELPNALTTYKQLKTQTSILPDVPLNGVLAERADEQYSAFARARIKSTGKITGRGSDFSSYLQIVNGTLDSYAAVIHKLEEKYSLHLQPRNWPDGMALGLEGEPFCLRFNRDIEIGKLINLMFNCTRPFRLMGEPERLADDYFVVDALDLHVNQPLSFEIAPGLMRIYLYEGTCGNTLVRVIRSLQHHIDANLTHPALLDD